MIANGSTIGAERIEKALSVRLNLRSIAGGVKSIRFIRKRKSSFSSSALL